MVENSAQGLSISIAQVLRIVFRYQITWDFISIPLELQDLPFDVGEVTLLQTRPPDSAGEVQQVQVWQILKRAGKTL
jgi:hypothetical protein